MKFGSIAVALGCSVVGTVWCGLAGAQAHLVAEARAQVAANGKDVAASLNLARTLRRAGVFQASLNELRRGLRLPEANAGATGIALRYEVARVFIDQGRFQEAQRACATLSSLPGGKAMAHVCHGEAHMIRKRASDALPEVAQALALSPNLYEARVVEGYALWQSGRQSDAEARLRDATQAHADRPAAWLALGRLYRSLGRKAEALQALEKAYAADGDDAVVANELATELGPNARAQSVLEAAIRARPSYGPAHARLGEVLMALGSLQHAEQEVRLALRSPNVESEWHALLAEVLVLRGDPDAALVAAAEALRMVPNQARAKLAQADALAAKGDIDLAIEAYQAAFSFGRRGPTALVHGAKACFQQNRETTAQAFADRAVQLFPKWAPAWEIVGDLAAKAGETQRARQAYRRALSGEGKVDRARIRQALQGLP